MIEEVLPRRRRKIMAAIAAVALVVGGLVSWAALASADARLDVDALPRWFRCNGTDIPYSIVNGDDETGGSPQPAFVVPFDTIAHPDTICQLQLTIVNQGSHTVRIESVAFPMLGVTESSGFPLELGENGANFPVSNPDDKGRAVVDVHESLEGGDTMDLLFDLRAREPREPHPGQITWADMLPEIKVSYRGFTGTTNGSVAIAVSG